MIRFAAKGTVLHYQHERWLAYRLGFSRGWDYERTSSLGVWNYGLKAVVVYHDYNPEAGTVCMSAAADGPWLNREVLYRMHAYPFEELGLQAVVLQVSERNARMLRIAGAYGYEMTRVPRLRGRDEAEILCVLGDDVWRESKFTRRYIDKQRALV